ncbi:MAG: asparagine synthase (glutamine-hydrolyzing) [Desulfobacterales bacterium]|nr:asparagine synthase (glutamine-hydrolyzing) [Desulfobacterales bacterium]
MCGIVGIWGKTESPLEDLIQKMRDIFPYRGPDSKALWINNSDKIGLGHRRLSILDITSSGNQPMSYNDLIIVYNGEIYNYIELRKELEIKGYSFKTGTDTEVLLASYTEWGKECLNRFNGMWAFAIWNKKNKKLFLSRDRLGIKPLYYYQTKDSFYFASEIKAILCALNNHPMLSPQLIDSYMSFGYIPGENTLFKGIKRLLPGHLLEITPQNLTITKYWDINFNNDYDLGFSHYLKQSRHILEDAAKIRLRSDVPLGIFLSGGIDSSTVVGLLSKKVPEHLKTFSVAYNFGSKYNETEYARSVSSKFNTKHYELFISTKEFQDFIPKFVWLMDEPVTESAAISLYFIAKLAKEHVTVILSGEGSDEIFAGYDLYHYMSIIEKYRHLLNPEIAQKIASFFPVGSKFRKYLSLSSIPFEKLYRGISTHEEHYKDLLYHRDFVDFIEKNKEIEFIENLFTKTEGKDILSRMLYFDIKTWLVDDLLIKADRMSMAASLELRVPFLDYRLVEFAATIPSHYKLHKGINKFILKKMVKDLLPKEIIDRKKMGFPTPLKIMFEKDLLNYSKDILLSRSAFIHSYFKKEKIENLINDHARKKLDHHRVIWQLIVLENWMQGFFNKCAS